MTGGIPCGDPVVQYAGLIEACLLPGGDLLTLAQVTAALLSARRPGLNWITSPERKRAGLRFRIRSVDTATMETLRIVHRTVPDGADVTQLGEAGPGHAASHVPRPGPGGDCHAQAAHSQKTCALPALAGARCTSARISAVCGKCSPGGRPAPPRLPGRPTRLAGLPCVHSAGPILTRRGRRRESPASGSGEAESGPAGHGFRRHVRPGDHETRRAAETKCRWQVTRLACPPGSRALHQVLIALHAGTGPRRQRARCRRIRLPGIPGTGRGRSSFPARALRPTPAAAAGDGRQHRAAPEPCAGGPWQILEATT
jgi:hypothetical protein